MLLYLIYAAVFGLIVGSFLNVIIVRRRATDWRDRETISGRSGCRTCERQLKWYENIPLFSWVLLRGRCKTCQERIPVHYPLVEAVTALLWLGVALFASSVTELISGLFFVTILVPITVIDLQKRIIPDELNYVLIWSGFALSLGFGPDSRFMSQQYWWIEIIVSASLAALFLLIPTLLTRGRGMGLGDVKLVLGLGAYLGASVTVGLFAAFALALIPSLIIIVTRGVKRGRKSVIPFGPFLAGGAIIAWFFGKTVLAQYLLLLA